jgi:hypothetical protein
VLFAEQTVHAHVHLRWALGNEDPQPIPPRCLSPLRGNTYFETVSGMTAVGPAGFKRATGVAAGREGMILQVDGDVIPGIYRAALTDDLALLLAGLLDTEGDLPFAVLRDTRESHLYPLDETDIGFVRRFADVVEAESVDHVLQALEGKSFGEEIWKQLAAAAFVLLLIEILLTRCEFEERTGPSASFREQLERVRTAGERHTGT